MFTGIIHHTASVLALTPHPTGKRLSLVNPFNSPDDPPKLGDSIAINGCCLTVTAMTQAQLAFDIIPQTLALTNLGQLTAGSKVHAERAMRLSDRLDGHILQGHIDGTGELVRTHTPDSTDGEWRTTLRLPTHLAKYLVPQGSISVDGVSLTIAAINNDTFDITLIPTTLELTHLGQHPPGYRFNIECDHTVKTIIGTLERMNLLPTAR